MRARAIVVLGVAAYAVFAVATVPAQLVARRASVPGAIELADAHGTLWNGSARATIGPPGAAISLGALHWRFLASRLLASRLAFAIDAQGDHLEAHGTIERGLTLTEARDLRLRADAAALAPLAASWRPEGAVTLSAPAVAWDGSEARGHARLEWRDAALALSGVRPLGSYRVDATADGGPARIAVATLEGPLRVSGTGTFAPPASLAFSGEARAEGPSSAALEPLLDLLGPRRPDGAHALQWRSTPGVARR